MKLDEWMATGAKTPEQLAKEIGVTGEAVRRYRTGARMPRPGIVRRIHAATGGFVTIADLYEQRVAFLDKPGEPRKSRKSRKSCKPSNT